MRVGTLFASTHLIAKSCDRLIYLAFVQKCIFSRDVCLEDVALLYTVFASLKAPTSSYASACWNCEARFPKLFPSNLGFVLVESVKLDIAYHPCRARLTEILVLYLFNNSPL